MGAGGYAEFKMTYVHPADSGGLWILREQATVPLAATGSGQARSWWLCWENKQVGGVGPRPPQGRWAPQSDMLPLQQGPDWFPCSAQP